MAVVESDHVAFWVGVRAKIGRGFVARLSCLFKVLLEDGNVNRKHLLVLLFVACIPLVVKNMADEMYMLSIQGALVFSAIWLLLPFLFLLEARWTKKDHVFIANTVYLLISLLFFALYAFNGSTFDGTNEGGQHMHVIMFPIYQVVIAILVRATFTLAHLVSYAVNRKKKAPAETLTDTAT
ncbi:MAG: hypothetical protein AMXMBFR84_06980 [Candidatus Hydrogenedentota bacterium]